MSNSNTAPLVVSMSVEIFDSGEWIKVDISFITLQNDYIRMSGPRSNITVRPRHCRNFRMNGVKAVMPANLEKFQKGFSVEGV